MAPLSAAALHKQILEARASAVGRLSIVASTDDVVFQGWNGRLSLKREVNHHLRVPSVQISSCTLHRQPFFQTLGSPIIGARAFIIIILFVFQVSAVNRGTEGSWELFRCLYLNLLKQETMYGFIFFFKSK